jgi:hypothetical protein
MIGIITPILYISFIYMRQMTIYKVLKIGMTIWNNYGISKRKPLRSKL